MNLSTLLLFGLGGYAVYWLVKEANPSVVLNPSQAASTGATYVPPQYGVQPGNMGWPSPAAPGPYGWGAIPQQPSAAQDAASIINAINGVAGTALNAVNNFMNTDNG